VLQADTGLTDNGVPISVDCQQAFSYFEDRGQLKNWKAVRPVMITTGPAFISVLLQVDYS
jgi:hypothetical protein